MSRRHAADERYPAIDSARLRDLFLEARLRWEAQPAEAPQADDLDEAWARLEDSLDRHPVLRHQVLAEAAGAPAEQERRQAEAAPLTVLPAIREAVRLMEAVYFRLRLEGAPGSAARRRSLAWLNRFGRWTGADLFRRWWPWLVPLHDRDFARFLEGELSLPRYEERFDEVRELDPRVDADAYALRRWREELGRDPRIAAQLHLDTADTTLFGFFLRFGPSWGTVNAAVAVVDCLPSAGGAGHVARWRAEDLYVPPGLWGVGIGEAFLRRLVAALGERGCRRAVVLTPRTCGAHWHTLYSSAAFSRLTRAGADGVESTTFEKELAEVPPV